MALKKLFHHTKKSVKQSNENGARRAVLEDLFYDFHRSRIEVYKINFIRGIFLGLGTALGGTVVVALVVWIMSFFVQLPVVGHQIEQVQQSIESGTNQ